MRFFLHVYIDRDQYTRDLKHEGRADGFECRGRGVAFVAAERGLVRAQGDGADRRVYT